MSEKLIFIVALTEHKYLGHLFTPYLVEKYPTRYSVHASLLNRDLTSEDFQFSDKEREIVRLAAKCTKTSLAAKFSREAPASDFFVSLNASYLLKNVIPYVQKQMYRIGLILMERKIPFFEKDSSYSNIYEEDAIAIFDEFARIIFSFSCGEEGTDYTIKLLQGDKDIRLFGRTVKYVSVNPCILLVSNQLHIFSDVDTRKIQPFISRETIRIAKQIELKYYRNFVSNIIRDHHVEATGFTIVEKNDKPVAVLCLEPDLKYTPVLVLRFRYGENEFLQNDSRRVTVSLEADGRDYTFYKTSRISSAESEYTKFLSEKGLREISGAFTFPNLSLVTNDEAVHYLVSWLSSNGKELAARGFEIHQGALDKRYYTGSQDVTFEIRGKGDWFDVYAVVKIGDFHFPFIKLRKYLLHGIREFELPNGEIAVLPDEWFERYKQVAEFARGEGNILNFQRHHYNFVRYAVMSIRPEIATHLEQVFDKTCNIVPPADLKAKLRKYQVTGYRWLYNLHRNKLGGCLADDMGLGKTLQALALLLRLKKASVLSSPNSLNKSGQLSLFVEDTGIHAAQPASLVVVPTSLVHNWINEIARFAPTLKIYRHTGFQRDLVSNAFDILQLYDVVISTYGIIRNDIEILKGLKFFYIILDESQYIKNPSSKTYKAVMEMNSTHRIVLTGTPVENSLSDLWAQMNFLNKGLLGSFPFFKHNYIFPVETKSDKEVTERLQLLIRPFILRRTKKEVAKDLPPVMEQIIYCPMTTEQQTSYEREKSLIRNTILENFENQGTRNSSVLILRGLMRLRQLANHPRMVMTESEDESGKFKEIVLSLRNLIAENHRVLIFSSFVTHLNLLKTAIEAENWKYCLLTGRTQNREEVIRKFQEGKDIPVFLISMKAGGVGLNLTAADYIFIVDPWWNPAVEDQAVSRAHRIGQKKHVFVYRFITENSIEEKIQVLKERKSSIADKFINQNDPFKQVTREEILALFG